MQYKDDVVFTGRLPDADLHRVMGAALSLVYVPFFEGFGIPIIEAFATHTPVITSAVTSMPEVAECSHTCGSVQHRRHTTSHAENGY